MGRRTSLDLLATLLLMHPRMPLAFLAARAHCWLMVNLSSTRTPRSLSAQLLSQNGLRAALQKRFGDTDGWKIWHELAMCARSPEGQPYPGLHPQQRGLQVKGGDSSALLLLPSTMLWWEPTWSPVSSSAALSTGKLDLSEQVQRRATKVMPAMEHLS